MASGGAPQGYQDPQVEYAPRPPNYSQQPSYPPQSEPQPSYPPQSEPQPSYPPQSEPQPSYPPQDSQPPQPSYPPQQQQPGYPPQPSYAPQPSYPPQGAQQPPQYPQTVPNYGSYQSVGGKHQQAAAVVAGQPTAAPTVTLIQKKPDNYMFLSIFTLLCCCWLFGIVAIIYAMQVDSAYASGDIVAAESASRSARTWNIVGIVFGCVSAAVSFIIIIISVSVSVAAAGSNDGYES